ncbi:ABC transporter ATP-binding protein [Pseudomonas sp. PA27(2017)]|uniref:ABC transporter ATP-binding protein n=1 Tax=Pseudomonas sp. PA27(2017) TaxID=1932112 RepID=UPI00096763CC|nr:ABC transporter ATP-binding protein [Pseudomonas sp. PA27(2017)]OLU33799.1 ABC transporter ATP-binding protein [Pseudomonas sp. PA27(2017)]
MRPVRGRVNLGVALSGLSSLCGLGSLVLLAFTLQRLLEEPTQWPWPFALVILSTLAAYGLRQLSFHHSHLAAFELERILRSELSEHLARVPLGEVQRLGAGALAKVLQDDVKALHVFVADSTPLLARAYLTPVAALLLMLWLDWRMALAALAVLLAGFTVLAVAMRGNQPRIAEYNAAREQVNAAVLEFVQAMPVVRSFDAGNNTFSRYQQALDGYLQMLGGWYRDVSFSARFSLALLNPLPTLLVLLAFGLLLPGSLTGWLAALLIGTAMAESMMPLMALKHLVNKAQLSVVRIQEVMALPLLVESTLDTRPIDASVSFDNVSFQYADHQDDALRALSFHLRPGTLNALVGPSGAGKSTVARLLPRFWDVSSGSIRIGGKDIRELRSDTLMKQVAFVFQESFLFAGSIADNIRLGLPANDAEVQAAAKAAQAHAFIEELPQGYATAVGERGIFLSGGQRQRIAIARAILQDRPILVLDEATAFNDPENEAELIQALAQLMRGKTVLMIAHRLSTIRGADQILVMDQGRLCEIGRHEQLLNQGGIYTRLWHSYHRAQDWSLDQHG